jgi:hypothetical protein
MLRTQYGNGRSNLPAPNISTTTGLIQGNNITYYFWVLGRNRVGYNNPSNITSITISNNKAIVINSSTFSTFHYEDWRSIIVLISTTNNFNNARVIYEQQLYESDNITPITLTNITINNDYVINGNTIIADTNSFPDATNLPNGYRIAITSNNNVYEYLSNSNGTINTYTADNFNSFPAHNGIWSLVLSNTLNETNVNYRKELYEVNSTELISSSLNLVLNNSVPIMYYIYNDSTVEYEKGELQLNSYCSDPSLNYTFNVKILGYFDYNANTLSTNGITYVNTTISYPANTITLSTPLPANNALVLVVYPVLDYTSVITDGLFITTYPKLNDYSTITSLTYWSSPLADLASLRAVPSSNYLDGQIRFVESVNQCFAFIASNTGTDDGITIITPNSNPTSGRWLVLASSILPGSITTASLSSSVLALITPTIKTTTINITTSTIYSIDLNANISYDYYIINTPNDGNTTTINIVASTIGNNQTYSCILELRQKSGVVAFDNSLLFPSGNVPILSGNNKTDILLVIINQDSSGTLKKRIMLVQKNIG